jgi:hypothetical protein
METHKVKEASAAQYSATLEDEAGVAIGSASMTTLTLTIFDESSDTAIVTDRDVLNANGGTLSSAGAFVYLFTAADNAIQGTSSIEPHIALFEWTWSSGTKSGNHSVKLLVENFRKVP